MRAALAGAFKRLMAACIEPAGASDHGVSEVLYLNKPDGNGVKLYCDRVQGEWPRDSEGGLAMTKQRLDLQSLLNAA